MPEKSELTLLRESIMSFQSNMVTLETFRRHEDKDEERHQATYETLAVVREAIAGLNAKLAVWGAMLLAGTEVVHWLVSASFGQHGPR